MSETVQAKIKDTSLYQSGLPFTTRQIWRELSLHSEDTARRTLDRMVGYGCLIKLEDGAYRRSGVRHWIHQRPLADVGWLRGAQ